MKSKLFFVPSHHDFDKEGVEATAEMLDHNSWPIVNHKSNPAEDKIQKIHKDAFNALTNITPFWTKVSIEVDEKNKLFIFPKRIWSNIYLYNDQVASFRHDTRHDNAAFHSLLEWPEITKLGSWGNEEEYEKELQKIIDWSSVENWTNFFKKRIKTIAEEQINNAIAEQAKAEDQIKFGQSILDALSL